jgi:hypothetical protein
LATIAFGNRALAWSRNDQNLLPGDDRCQCTKRNGHHADYYALI